jgi:integrase
VNIQRHSVPYCRAIIIDPRGKCNLQIVHFPGNIFEIDVDHFPDKPNGPFALRHSGASIMENNNVPIVAIQEILGHENRTTTEIYLHSVSGAARSAMTTYELARRNSHTTEKCYSLFTVTN